MTARERNRHTSELVTPCGGISRCRKSLTTEREVVVAHPGGEEVQDEELKTFMSDMSAKVATKLLHVLPCRTSNAWVSPLLLSSSPVYLRFAP